jgi:hypothetical protein
MDAPQAAPDGTMCIQCGLELRGIRVDSNCPKCGTAVERSLGALPRAVPDSAICVRCAYSLRGLAPGGVCPECGLPVERSLRGDLLVYSDPEYIRKLATGSRLVLWSTAAVIFVIVGEVILAIAGQEPLVRVLGLGLPVANLTFCLGWWMLTWPDIGQLSTNKGQRPRRIVRVTSAVIFCFILASACAPMYRGLVPPGLTALLTVFTVIAMAVGFLSGMLYIRWLAPRIPDGGINRLAKTLLILIGSMIGALVLTAMTSGHGDPGCAAVTLVLGAAVAGIISVIGYCMLFARLRAALLSIEAAQRDAMP